MPKTSLPNLKLIVYLPKTARPHPFDTKKVEVDFSKKSIFMDFRGKKSRLSSSKKVDLRILGAKISRYLSSKDKVEDI